MTVNDFRFRAATITDVPALAQLHVATFVETHGCPGPSCAVRERQWGEAFSQPSDDWFCVVIVSPDGELVGFAKGVPHHGKAESPRCSCSAMPEILPTASTNGWALNASSLRT